MKLRVFFEKVWHSLITGAVAGVIIGILSNGNFEVSLHLRKQLASHN